MIRNCLVLTLIKDKIQHNQFLKIVDSSVDSEKNSKIRKICNLTINFRKLRESKNWQKSASPKADLSPAFKSYSRNNQI